MSLSHTLKGDKRTLNCESLIIILLTYIRYICKLHSSSNKQKQREHTFFHNTSALYRRPNKTAKCNFSCFQILLCLLFLSFHLSLCSFLNFAHFERKHIRTCALLHAHTQTRTQQSSSLSLSLRYETLTRRCQATATRAQVQMLG